MSEAKEIKEYAPCSLEVLKREFPMNTICNDLREIYFEAEKMGNEKIMLLSRIAITKGKRMSRKLFEYNQNIDHELWVKK